MESQKEGQSWKNMKRVCLGNMGKDGWFELYQLICVFPLLILILSGQLLCDWMTSLLCAVNSQSLASMVLCSHLRFGLQWGVAIWVLLQGGHQCSPCVCHWQATWLMPSNRLTSCNVHFSLSDQLILTWSSNTLGDSELLWFPPTFPLKMLMNLLNHDASLILLENSNYCMIEEKVDLQENIAAYLLAWLSKFTNRAPLQCDCVIERLRTAQLPKWTNLNVVKQKQLGTCSLWYCTFLDAQMLTISPFLWFFWLDWLVNKRKFKALCTLTWRVINNLSLIHTRKSVFSSDTGLCWFCCIH